MIEIMFLKIGDKVSLWGNELVVVEIDLGQNTSMVLYETKTRKYLQRRHRNSTQVLRLQA